MGAGRRDRGVVVGRRELGVYGERLAERYLREQGMRILARNWRAGRGEIDLVALDGDCAVVCEVKTRRGAGFGDPVEAVSWSKQAALRQLAARWVAQCPLRVGELRIDVVGVLVPACGPVQVRHVRGVGG